MTLNQYKSTLTTPLLQTTGSILIQDNQILLGLKKRGLGIGNLVAIGGKIDPGETPEQSAIRELNEEILITSPQLHYAATLNFYLPNLKGKTWNIQNHIFTCHTWQGTPQETEEIQPSWFDQPQIPFEKMWDDAKYWLPKILNHQQLQAEFLFDETLKVVDYTCAIIEKHL
jgi:8-oxo-dGTP diphosphatase